MVNENGAFKTAWKKGFLKVWIICLAFSLAFLIGSIYALNKSFAENEVNIKGRLSTAKITGVSTILGSGISLVYEYTDDYGNIQTGIFYHDYSYDDATDKIGTELEIYIYGEKSMPAGRRANLVPNIVFLTISFMVFCFFFIMALRDYLFWKPKDKKNI